MNPTLAYLPARLASLPTWARVAVTVAVLGAMSLALSEVAEARVGGGQGFSSGRRSGGGGSGGGSGGGGGDLGDLFFLLIYLAIHYPVIGVPLLLLFVGAVLVRVLFFSGGSSGSQAVFDTDESDGHVRRAHAPQVSQRKAARRTEAVPGLKALRDADSAFSVPVFLDFAGLVHRRALEAVTTGRWEPLTPFVSEGAREQLAGQFGGRRIRDVVLGATSIERITPNARDGFSVRVRFEANYTLESDQGEGQLFVRSAWVFRRANGVLSLPPDATLALACPSCGNPVDTDPLGACKSCGTPITAGQLQWQASATTVISAEPVTPPQLGFTDGGAEPSFGLPTVSQPELSAALRRFQGRHPDFDDGAFLERVKTVYHELQGAWSDNRWERARPFVTDPLYQQLRFWMDGYQRNGLRNQLADVALLAATLVKVEEDAWYDAITVRIRGSMKDATIDGKGRVVAGNPNLDRKFSEYWTFLRASGTGAASPPAGRCPSCGAPLDRIGSTGICGYCDSKITTGKFDWVLSRIDQAEVYTG